MELELYMISSMDRFPVKAGGSGIFNFGNHEDTVFSTGI